MPTGIVHLEYGTGPQLVLLCGKPADDVQKCYTEDIVSVGDCDPMINARPECCPVCGGYKKLADLEL